IVTVVAGDIFQKTLEVVHVAVHSAAEFTIRLILALDVVESLLSFQRVKATGEYVTLTATVTIPELNRSFMIDSAGNIHGKGVERFNHMAWRTWCCGRLHLGLC